MEFRDGGIKVPETKEDITQKNVVDDNFQQVSEYQKKSLLDKINFILYEYEEQEKSISNKLNNLRSTMYLYIIAFVVIGLVDLYFTILLNEYSVFFPGAWGTLILKILVSIAMWKFGFHMIEHIYEYNVHNETLCFINYKTKHGIFTLKAEVRFCNEQILGLKDLVTEINISFDEGMQRQYKDLEYKERRADQNVFPLFRKHKLIFNVVAVILSLF